MEDMGRTHYMRVGLGWILAAALILTPAISAATPDGSAQKTWSEDRRFLDNGDGTISDTQTGLMWVKKDSYLHTGRMMNWSEAFEYVRSLNENMYADYMDWRMPTLDELRTLYEADKTNSAQVGREMKIHIDPIFGKEGCGALWSSEDDGHFNALGIIFNTGQQFSSNKKSRSRRATRAVRVIHDPQFRKNHLDKG